MQIHSSCGRCVLCSCRFQSDFLTNPSPHQVHWYVFSLDEASFEDEAAKLNEEELRYRLLPLLGAQDEDEPKLLTEVADAFLEMAELALLSFRERALFMYVRTC